MSQSRRAILFLLSSATALELRSGRSIATGIWARELLDPYFALVEAGFEVIFVSPDGRAPRLDPQSLPDAETARRSVERQFQALPGVRNPHKLPEVLNRWPHGIEALVIPGGYAPMVDLPGSPDVARLLQRCHEEHILVAAICHGPAALLSLDAGSSPFRTHRMVSFTNAEEDDWLGDDPPTFLLESALVERGANYEAGGLWSSTVVRDRGLLTAQNSPSCPRFVELLLEALSPRLMGVPELEERG